MRIDTVTWCFGAQMGGRRLPGRARMGPCRSTGAPRLRHVARKNLEPRGRAMLAFNSASAFRSILFASAASGALTASMAFADQPPAPAQQAQASATTDQAPQGLETIVVTARRVEERNQDVPVSVTAF